MKTPVPFGWSEAEGIGGIGTCAEPDLQLVHKPPELQRSQRNIG